MIAVCAAANAFVVKSKSFHIYPVKCILWLECTVILLLLLLQTVDSEKCCLDMLAFYLHSLYLQCVYALSRIIFKMAMRNVYNVHILSLHNRQMHMNGAAGETMNKCIVIVFGFFLLLLWGVQKKEEAKKK